jgi:hypothetical protein
MGDEKGDDGDDDDACHPVVPLGVYALLSRGTAIAVG